MFEYFCPQLNMKNLKEDNFDHYHIPVFAGYLSFFFFFYSFPIAFWLNDYRNFCLLDGIF